MYFTLYLYVSRLIISPAFEVLYEAAMSIHHETPHLCVAAFSFLLFIIYLFVYLMWCVCAQMCVLE